jgi:hypothetical protein
MRTVSRVTEASNVARDTAYARALVWFESNHDRANIRVTGRDPETATVAGSGEMQCTSSASSGLRAMGLGLNQTYLRFNVQFQAKDDRYRITFSELFYYLTDIRYPSSNLTQGPSNQADVDALYRDCLQGLETSLRQAVTGPATGPDF